MSEIILTDGNFDEEISKYQGVALIDFFADWCGPCKILAPILEKLADQYSGKVKIGKVDVEANEKLVDKFGIRNMPTLIFFKNGEAVETLVGFQSEGALKAKLDSLLG